MKKIIAFSALVFLIFGTAKAQADREIISASFDLSSKKLELTPKVNPELSPALKKLLGNQENYTIYQIVVDDPPTNAKLPLDSLLAERDAFECVSKKTDRSDCLAMTVDLDKSNFSAGYYLVKIKGLKNLTANTSDSLMFAIGEASVPPTPKTSIAADIENSRNKIRIKSDLPITVDKTLEIKDDKYKIAKDGKTAELKPNTTQNATVLQTNSNQPATTSQTAKEFTLVLDKKLSESETHNLKIEKGIRSESQKDIKKTEGKISFPQLPTDPGKLRLDTSFSFEKKITEKASYDIKFKYDSQDLLPVGNCQLALYRKYPCFFQPKIELAFGFGSSKNDDTLTIDLPFRSTISLGQPTEYNRDDAEFSNLTEEQKATLVPNYYGWRKTPRYKGNIYFFAGPKIESDKKFKRTNLLGSLRFDYRSYRFLSSIARKRKLLIGTTYGIEKEQAELVEINSGNTFIPYFGIDFGGRIRSEPLKDANDVILTTIPRYSIFRSYLGFSNTLETQIFGRPFDLKFEGKGFHFAREEQVGIVEGSLFNIRRIKGFQHYGSFSLDVYFTKMRRYSFNVTYENGRKAPDFEYLNKVTAGIKARY